MEFEVKKIPGSKVELIITLSVDEWDKFVSETLKKISAELKVDGFRPGAVLPREIIEREVGSAAILQEAAESAIRKTYPEVIVKNDIQAIGSPKVEIVKMSEGNPFIFKIEVSVLPDVELPDYQAIAQKISQQRKEVKVEEKEIDDSIEWLRKSRAKLKVANRSAQKGDLIEIDFEGYLNGQLVDELKSKNHPIVLGENRLVRGFEEHLIGLKENEEKEFSLLFPEDYYSQELRGQLVNFKVKVKSVQERELPELNDDFARSLGKFDNLSDLRNKISDNLKIEKEEKEKERIRSLIIREIAQAAKMELPEVLVKSETERMIEELKGNLEKMGMEFEKYLKEIGKEKDALEKEWKSKAEERIRVALCLGEIARREKIEVKEDEIESKINELLRPYQNISEAEKSISAERLREYSRELIRNQKVFELLEKVKSSTK